MTVFPPSTKMNLVFTYIWNHVGSYKKIHLDRETTFFFVNQQKTHCVRGYLRVDASHEMGNECPPPPTVGNNAYKFYYLKALKVELQGIKCPISLCFFFFQVQGIFIGCVCVYCTLPLSLWKSFFSIIDEQKKL